MSNHPMPEKSPVPPPESGITPKKPPSSGSTPAYDAIILGGGAAGFFAAIRAAEENPSARILILEKARRPLGKVLISGGGRCNITHACFDAAQLVSYYPRGAAALRGAFSRFQPADTARWFESRGVKLKTEADGRMFPTTDNSQTIADCLENAAQEAGVTLWTQVTALQVDTVSTPGPDRAPRFRVTVRKAAATRTEELTARSLLFATGSDSASQALLSGLGHTVEPAVPSLFTFNIKDARLDGLAGLSVPQAELRLLEPDGAKSPIASQRGPLLITHWGLSGPAALRTSAWGARWLHERQYRAGLTVNWFHPLTTEKAHESLQNVRNNPANLRKKPGAHPLFDLPTRLWARFVSAAGIAQTQNWADVSKAAICALAEELTVGHYTISGKGQFKDEFVTCGGVRLDEVNFKTMESKKIPGLFFAGEVLDIDGLTGGFNFQNAWTTGWMAGGALLT
jgi:predicted Rossmann fold flavoprotein